MTPLRVQMETNNTSLNSSRIMAIKLHGSPFSPAAQRVLVTLEEKNLEYEFIVVDMQSGAHKKEPFISLNPFGQVPALEDGDLKLFESRAITHYLASNYADKGTPLLSQDPKKQAIIGVWSEVESHAFDSAAIKVSTELIVKPMFGQATDEAVLAEYQDKLSKVLDVYEERLTQSKFLGGDAFNLADLHHTPAINSLFNTKVKAIFEARPHVSAWAKDLLARPAWQKVLGRLKY